jgi:hypothetical protein
MQTNRKLREGGGKKMGGFTEEDVQLAERYAKALETIERLNQEVIWTEGDVEAAEKYAAALDKIAELAD